MPVYCGTVERGRGHAHQHYGLLIDRVATMFGEVKSHIYGTINVRLDNPMERILCADHWTPRMLWCPDPATGMGSIRKEAFGFVAIDFGISSSSKTYKGWIVLPEGHRWSHTGIGVEIITDQLIPDIRYSHRCTFSINHRPSMTRPAWFGSWRFAHQRLPDPEYFFAVENRKTCVSDHSSA